MSDKKPVKNPCECTDPGCPACAGKCKRAKVTILQRIDMEDHTGTAMCRACANDAMDSALFNEKPHLRLPR